MPSAYSKPLRSRRALASCESAAKPGAPASRDTSDTAGVGGVYTVRTDESVLTDDDVSQDDRAGAHLRAPLEARGHQLRFPAGPTPDQLTVIYGSDSGAEEHLVGQHARASDVGAG